MKNLTFFFLIFFISGTCLFSQTEKGNFTLSLHNYSPSGIFSNSGIPVRTNALGFYSGTYKSELDGNDAGEAKTFSAGLNVSGHYFLIDNFSIGLNSSFFYFSTKLDGADEAFSGSIYQIAPELRYYFDIAPEMKLYISGDAGFGQAVSNSSFDDEDEPINLTSFSGGLGMSYFMRENISFDFGIRYAVEGSKEEDNFSGVTRVRKEQFSGVGLDVGVSIFFGGEKNAEE